MPKTKKMTPRQFKNAWGKLPKSDRRFIVAMIQLLHILPIRTLRYAPLTAHHNAILARAGRRTLLSLLANVVERLARSHVLARAHRIHGYKKIPIHRPTKGAPKPAPLKCVSPSIPRDTRQLTRECRVRG